MDVTFTKSATTVHKTKAMPRDGSFLRGLKTDKHLPFLQGRVTN